MITKKKAERKEDEVYEYMCVSAGGGGMGVSYFIFWGGEYPTLYRDQEKLLY